jgi:hypothetical protein
MENPGQKNIRIPGMSRFSLPDFIILQNRLSLPQKENI